MSDISIEEKRKQLAFLKKLNELSKSQEQPSEKEKVDYKELRKQELLKDKQNE